MKLTSVWKRAYLIFLVLLLLATMIVPAAAQGPEDGDSDVEMALSFHSGLGLSPVSDWWGGIPQQVPSGGLATTEVTVTDVEDLYSINLAFDYHADALEVISIGPGALLANLTPGVDYIMTTNLNRAVPLDPLSEPLIPADPIFDAARPTYRSYVNIAIINYDSFVSLHGNGSLVKIDWQVANVGLGTATPLYFTIADLLDEFGNTIVGPLMDPGFLEVGESPVGLKFQVALEGGKPSHPSLPGINGVGVEATKLGATIPGVVSSDGRVYIPATPPYDTVVISREGYLSADATNVNTTEWPLITLTAGDINGDNRIDIFDITLVASVFNSSVDGSQFLEKMDFNDDFRVTIADLALVAKNYGIVGPSPAP